MEIKSIRRTNTAKLQKGSLTVEAACVMPVILLTLTGTLYLCFHVHNRAWLTSAAYESALCGSMEGIKKNGSACDAVIDLPTVSRIHAKIRKKEEGYYLTDMNSRNGTMVNGRLLLPDEEYRLQNEGEMDFAQARYVFLE